MIGPLQVRILVRRQSQNRAKACEIVGLKERLRDRTPEIAIEGFDDEVIGLPRRTLDARSPGPSSGQAILGDRARKNPRLLGICLIALKWQSLFHISRSANRLESRPIHLQRGLRK